MSPSQGLTHSRHSTNVCWGNEGLADTPTPALLTEGHRAHPIQKKRPLGAKGWTEH